MRETFSEERRDIVKSLGAFFLFPLNTMKQLGESFTDKVPDLTKFLPEQELLDLQYELQDSHRPQLQNNVESLALLDPETLVRWVFSVIGEVAKALGKTVQEIITQITGSAALKTRWLKFKDKMKLIPELLRKLADGEITREDFKETLGLDLIFDLVKAMRKFAMRQLGKLVPDRLKELLAQIGLTDRRDVGAFIKKVFTDILDGREILEQTHILDNQAIDKQKGMEVDRRKAVYKKRASGGGEE